MNRPTSVASLLFAVGLAGCGGSSASSATPDASVSPTLTDGGAEASSDASGGGSLFGDGAPPYHDVQHDPTPDLGADAGVDLPGTCPATVPAIGDACTVPGAICSYGDDYLPGCRDWRGCQGGQWQPAGSSGIDACGSFTSLCAGAAKPTDLPRCDVDGGSGTAACSCHFADGTLCRFYGDPSMNTGGMWSCVVPTQAAGCPPKMPNVGTACTGSASCQYAGGSSSCSDGALVACANGVWNGYDCPGPVPLGGP